MQSEPLAFPDYYPWANRLSHYLALHATKAAPFRAGDWFRFLHNEDVQALLNDITWFNLAAPEAHQDLILVAGLLFMKETERSEFPEAPRFVGDLLQQLGEMLHLEGLRREGLVYLEQRLSIAPGFSPELMPTLKGQAYLREHGDFPPPSTPVNSALRSG